MWPYIDEATYAAWQQLAEAASAAGFPDPFNIDPERPRLVRCPTCDVRWHYPTLRKCWVDGRHKKFTDKNATTGGQHSWGPILNNRVPVGHGDPEPAPVWLMPRSHAA